MSEEHWWKELARAHGIDSLLQKVLKSRRRNWMFSLNGRNVVVRRNEVRDWLRGQLERL